jgi:catechol 2,3-dioxygenase-like lactoylglutathione lyase family enzyme
MPDVGLTHIALPISDAGETAAFYKKYAGMEVIHRRHAPEIDGTIIWITDHTRPFVLVLYETKTVAPILADFAHLGVACESREEVDRLCALAKDEGILLKGPTDTGPPVGYWAFIKDPNGHTLEVAYGQETGLLIKTSEEQTA